MTDDIAARLRTCSSALRSHYTVGAVERIPTWTMDEAADEIERLRSEVRRWVRFNHDDADEIVRLRAALKEVLFWSEAYIVLAPELNGGELAFKQARSVLSKQEET